MEKWPSVDPLLIYSKCTEIQWKAYLKRCADRNDIHELVKTRYGLQLGMKSLAKKKLNTQKIVNWYCWAMGSIERRIRFIMKKKNPMKLDNSFNMKKMTKQELKRNRASKKLRENDLLMFLKRENY